MGGWAISMPNAGSSQCTSDRQFRHVAFGDLVEYLGIVGQRLKAMRETGWDVQGEPVILGQLGRTPVTVCRGIAAQIQQHIEDRSPRAANQLGLRMRRTLEMHAAQACHGVH